MVPAAADDPPGLGIHPDARLLTAEDRLEIGGRLSLYGLLIDDRDWAGLSRIFTPDAVFDVSDIGFPPASGLAAIVHMMESVQHPRAHLITNAVIADYGVDWARTRCRLLAVEDDLSVHVGQYRDEFTRTPQGWRIWHRRFTSVPEGSIQGILIDPT